MDRRERAKGRNGGDRRARRVRVGQILMLREATQGFPRGTAVKVVAAAGLAADSTCVVEPYRPSLDGTRRLDASGVRLTVAKAALAESLPEFSSGTTVA